MGAAPPPQPDHHPIGQQEIADDTVDELHQTGIFKEVAPERAQLQRVGRDHLPRHERPVDIVAPGIEARHQRPYQDLQKCKMQPARGQPEQPRLLGAAGLHQVALAAPQLQDGPGQQPKDDKGQAQMGGQPVGGDRGHALALGDARGDHPSANRALHPAQHAGQDQPPGPASGDLARQQEAEEPQRPDQTDHPAQLAVAPFPPVDRLEIRQFHPLVLQAPLVDLLVFVEFGLPVGLAQRRNRARDRAPFGDRETAVGQPGQPAHHDHRHHQCKEHRQPGPDRAARAAPSPVDHTGLRRRRPSPVRDLLKDAALAAHAILIPVALTAS